MCRLSRPEETADLRLAERLEKYAIETMRRELVRGFVLDGLQVAGERDGFDGGRLVYAMLDLLCYHSKPAPAKSERQRLLPVRVF